jgi:ABC-type glycerol-3-phosphate transport system substrate-binding protein
VIYKKSRNADRAKDALEYVMQPEVIQKIADSAAGRSVPPFKDLANTEFWKKPPYDALVKIVGEVGRPRYYPFGESAWGAAVISAQPIATMLENHLQKNMPADQAYQAAFQEIQTQYEKFK